MRSLLFNTFFLVVTTLYAFVCVILSLLPGRRIMMGSLRRYTRLMVWGMRVIAGIKVEVTGHELCHGRRDYEIPFCGAYPEQDECCGD